MAVPTPLSRLHARRLARIAFSTVVVAGAFYLVVVTLTSIGLGCTKGDSAADNGPFGAAEIIIGTWVAALGAAQVVRFIASRLRFDRTRDWLFIESVMAPAFAIPLLLPLTLHMPFALAAGGNAMFDFWVFASVIVTGLAHVVFAISVMCRAADLVDEAGPTSPRKIVLVTVGVSCVPFIVLFAIPPILVAITGMVLMPLLSRMELWINAERRTAQGIADPLPRAVML